MPPDRGRGSISAPYRCHGHRLAHLGRKPARGERIGDGLPVTPVARQILLRIALDGGSLLAQPSFQAGDRRKRIVGPCMVARKTDRIGITGTHPPRVDGHIDRVAGGDDQIEEIAVYAGHSGRIGRSEYEMEIIRFGRDTGCHTAFQREGIFGIEQHRPGSFPGEIDHTSRDDRTPRNDAVRPAGKKRQQQQCREHAADRNRFHRQSFRPEHRRLVW